MRSHSRKRVAICGVSVDIPHCARNRWGDSALVESMGQAHSRRTQGVRLALGAGRASNARRAGGTPLPQYQSVTIRSVTCKVSLSGSVEEHELLWPESYRTLLEDGTASYKSIAHRSRANFFRGKSRACGGLLRSGPVSGPASRARSSARAIRSGSRLLLTSHWSTEVVRRVELLREAGRPVERVSRGTGCQVLDGVSRGRHGV